MVGESNQNVVLIHKDALNFEEFEIIRVWDIEIGLYVYFSYGFLCQRYISYIATSRLLKLKKIQDTCTKQSVRAQSSIWIKPTNVRMLAGILIIQLNSEFTDIKNRTNEERGTSICDNVLLLFNSYQFVKGFLATTFLSLVFSNWNFHDVCQRFLYDHIQNFS